MKNLIIAQVEQANLGVAEQKSLLDQFTAFYQQAEDWEAKAKAIKVTSPDQTADMQMARVARLELKKIRVDAEKTRKSLKEESLRKGQTIDAIAKILKNAIEPIEQYLQEQEDFVKIQEEKALQARYEERLKSLEKYEYDPTTDIKGMSDELFNGYLQSLENAFQERIAQEKAEQERLKKEAEEQERIRKENEKLRAEAEAREKAIAEERSKHEAEKRAQEEKLRAEAEAREKAEKALSAQHQCPQCGHKF